MSKSKDIARAESGLLFRNGRLVPASDVKGTLQNQLKQEKVDQAIKELKGEKD